MTMLTELLISGGTYNYVWPYANGREIEQVVEPLVTAVLDAVLKDDVLYEYLALVDAIRLGNQRGSWSRGRPPQVKDHEQMTSIRAQLLEMMKAVASALGEDLRSRLAEARPCYSSLIRSRSRMCVPQTTST